MPTGGYDDVHGEDYSGDEEEDPGEGGENTLLISRLQNPNDALRLLASASSLSYGRVGQNEKREVRWAGDDAAIWTEFEPIEEGCVTVQEAQALFTL